MMEPPIIAPRRAPADMQKFISPTTFYARGKIVLSSDLVLTYRRERRVDMVKSLTNSLAAAFGLMDTSYAKLDG